MLPAVCAAERASVTHIIIIMLRIKPATHGKVRQSQPVSQRTVVGHLLEQCHYVGASPIDSSRSHWGCQHGVRSLMHTLHELRSSLKQGAAAAAVRQAMGHSSTSFDIIMIFMMNDATPSHAGHTTNDIAALAVNGQPPYAPTFNSTMLTACGISSTLWQAGTAPAMPNTSQSSALLLHCH